MKTNEPGIEKINGEKGTIYRVQIRKKGYKHQSRSFTNFRAAKKWKYNTINALSSGEITDTATIRRTLEEIKMTISFLVEARINRSISELHGIKSWNRPRSKTKDCVRQR